MVNLEIKDEIMMGKMDSREKINKHKTILQLQIINKC